MHGDWIRQMAGNAGWWVSFELIVIPSEAGQVFWPAKSRDLLLFLYRFKLIYYRTLNRPMSRSSQILA